MWIFVSGGFVYIVAHRDKPMHVLVRARHPEHIETLLPGHAQTKNMTADYPYRVTAHRTVVQRALMYYVMNMEYDNFKSSIDDQHFHDACISVWRDMYEYGLRHR